MKRGQARRLGSLLVAQVINLGAVLVVVRLYPPAAFGQFASLFAVAVVVAGVSAFRLEIAITTASDDDAAALIGVARRLNVAVGGGAALVGLAWSATAGRVDDGGLLEVVALGAVVTLFGLSNTLTYACVRDERYGLVAASRLAVAVVSASGQIAFGLLDPTPGGLLVASAAGYGAGALLLRLRLRVPASGVRVRTVLDRHRGFVVAAAPASLMNSLALNLPVLVAVPVAGGAAAADLALAMRVGLMPIALLGQALLPIVFGEVARQVRTTPETALAGYDRALVRLLMLGTGCLVVLAVGVHALAGRIFGAEWVGVGTMLLILTPFLIAQFAVSPLGQTLNALGRNWDQFVWDACRLTGLTLAFVPLVAGWIDLRAAVACFSALTVVAYVGHVSLARRALRMRAGRNLSRDRSGPETDRPAQPAGGGR
ncbi:hypothetical protein O7627_19295 [Solwaraspora sp. WMMD1047]|uniref:lipopolysaccharide biosynthesis protein n=1 Tax=Solwaraspora sp. WMMD1047 TaxID=3016102 RepID=UPI00241757D6|nr:hypothetical protein [Solwaraspora sp. WMMD1047]MDG4831446.1 hypothetical protein [Solwaraspora sp. WMMD1047]